jgi:hypothetical protein
MKNKANTPVGNIGMAIGIGLVAGVIGTVAITVSQMIEMKINGREPSDAPVKAVDQVLNVKPTSDEDKEKVSQEIHWTYGTAWGVVRGLISLTGLSGIPASLLHFAAIWGTELYMLPALKVAPPVTEEEPDAIVIDALHHAVYAAAAGLAFDAITRSKPVGK